MYHKLSFEYLNFMISIPNIDLQMASFCTYKMYAWFYGAKYIMIGISIRILKKILFYENSSHK